MLQYLAWLKWVRDNIDTIKQLLTLIGELAASFPRNVEPLTAGDGEPSPGALALQGASDDDRAEAETLEGEILSSLRIADTPEGALAASRFDGSLLRVLFELLIQYGPTILSFFPKSLEAGTEAQGGGSSTPAPDAT